MELPPRPPAHGTPDWQTPLFVRYAGTVVAGPPATLVCPRCNAPSVVDLGEAHSTARWYRCLACDHIWPVQPKTDTTPAPKND
jgi:hypothetical protein